ncbi:unnamed protein product [Spodoptera exigua]|nr:unnamed protein product [Spodoptera exigua]
MFMSTISGAISGISSEVIYISLSCANCIIRSEIARLVTSGILLWVRKWESKPQSVVADNDSATCATQPSLSLSTQVFAWKQHNISENDFNCRAPPLLAAIP